MSYYPQYKNSKLCKGGGSVYKPCGYLDECTICTNYAFDTRQGNNNELYRVFGMPLACKRDNPTFKPYTVKEFEDMCVEENISEDKKKEYFSGAIRLGLVKE
jgi:hypothetical protein